MYDSIGSIGMLQPKRTRPSPEFDLFRGREGRNNERIMELLSREKLNRYQIAKRLGKKYSTIFDRLQALQSSEMIKEVGWKDAEKSRVKIPFYGLDVRGLYAALMYSGNASLEGNALRTCGRLFSDSWQMFSGLYGFDSQSIRSIDKWVRSANGVKSILRQFGYWALSSEPEMLLTFRRLIDLAIYAQQLRFSPAVSLAYVGYVGAAEESRILSEIRSFTDALRLFGRIARSHSGLRKVYAGVKDADSVLFEKIRIMAKHATVEVAQI